MSLSATIEVQQIEGSEELFIAFPDEIIEAVGMDEWEWIKWDVQPDGSVIISKADEA